MASRETTAMVTTSLHGTAPRARALATAILVAATLGCQAALVKPALHPGLTASHSPVTIAAVRRAAARGQWSQVLTMAPQVTHAEADDDSPAALRILALYQLDRAPAARLAEEALIAQLPKTSRDLIAVATVHWRRFKHAEAAWRTLKPALGDGCHTAASCSLARQLLVALPTLPTWLTAAQQVAPAAGHAARLAWMTALAQAMTAAGRLDMGWALLVAEGRVGGPPTTHWAIALFQLAPKMPGGQGKRVWYDAVLGAGVTAATLAELANHVEIAADRTLATQMLTEATKRPDAPPCAWTALARALARQDNRAGLTEMSARAKDKFETQEARLVMARAAVAVRLVPLAEEWLGGLEADDAVVLAIAAEIARLRGQGPQARALAQRVTTDASGDRSLGGLVVGQLWRGLGDGYERVAAQALETAAQTKGRGQASAARLRAMDLGKTGNGRATQAALVQWGMLLAGPPGPDPGDLSEDPEPPPDRVRAFILERVAGGAGSELRATLLRAWANAGVADAGQLRALAIHEAVLRRTDAALAADEAARAAADAALQPLESDGELGAVLRAALGSAGLARWLAGGGKRSIDDQDRVMAGHLLAGHFAVLAMRMADRAQIYLPPADVKLGTVVEWIANGGGEAASHALRDSKAQSKPADLETSLVQLQLQLAAGQGGIAANDMAALFAPGSTWTMRALKPVFELAVDHGLCATVIAAAPRMLAESDLQGFRIALARSLDCARKLQDEPAARGIVKAVFGNRPEASKLDALTQQLVIAGFDRLATQIGMQLQQIAPPTEDARHAWARAHLALGEAEEAAEVLRRAANVNPRNTRMWLRAAEVLDDYGQLERAVAFYRGASVSDPDSTRIHARVALALLRLGKTTEAAEELLALAKLGGSEEDFRILLETVRRTRTAKAIYLACMAAPDADREFERFRVELAADLGDRPAVLAGVRRLRTKGAALAGQAIQWLHKVGAWREAREAAEDSLASAEPLGGGEDAGQLLAAALEVRRDPSSSDEAAGLARLAATRAADPDEAAALAAQELGRHGLAVPGWALSKGFAANRKLLFLCLRASLAWKAGLHDEALALWRQVHSAALVDPQLADKLRTRQQKMTNDPSDLNRAISWTVSALDLAGERRQLLAMVADFEQVDPQSEWTRYASISALLHSGDFTAASAQLRTASLILPTWTKDLDALADGIVRHGGWSSLAGSVGLSGDASATGAAATALVRTSAWWLALITTAAPKPDQLPAELSDTIVRLAAYWPQLRLELANAAAACGDGSGAVRWLGDKPLVCPEGRLKPTVEAMAAALAALQGAPDPALAGHDGVAVQRAAADQLDRWLISERGSDAAALLAYELTRQGHPELAARCVQAVPQIIVGMQPDQLQRRFLAAIGYGDTEAVVQAAQLFLRGQRSELATGDPNQPMRGPSDDVFTALVAAGRTDAAVALLGKLRQSEFGVGLPPGMAAKDETDWAARVAAADPTVLADLRKDIEAAPLHVVTEAFGLAVAASPATVEGLAAAVAKRNPEPWRTWYALVRAAIDWEEPALARIALARARQAGAPGTALACTALVVGESAEFGPCRAGRTLDDLDVTTLADVAIGVAQNPLSADAQSLAASFTANLTSTQAAFVGAASMRRGWMSADQKGQFGQWLRKATAAMVPSRQDEFAQAAMEDLGEFGMAERGATLMAQAMANHPRGQGQSNNLAYARLLAGHPLAHIVPLAQAAEWSSGGKAAYAALDTLAAAQAQAGDLKLALRTQRRALAAATTPALERRVPVGLPLARMAELLLADGQLQAALTLAAAALAHEEGQGELRDEFGAVGRLRRVLKAALRGTSAR